MKLLTKATLAACGILVAVSSASAVQIDGEICFTGTFSGDTTIHGATRRFITFSDVMILNPDGQYHGTEGTTVSMQGFTFRRFSSLDEQWMFTYGGKEFCFDLETLESLDTSNRTRLGLSGVGTAHITGFDPTPGIWTFDAVMGGSFTAKFTTTPTTTAVPDGGATVGLLGLASLSLVFLGRRALARI